MAKRVTPPACYLKQAGEPNVQIAAYHLARNFLEVNCGLVASGDCDRLARFPIDATICGAQRLWVICFSPYMNLSGVPPSLMAWSRITNERIIAIDISLLVIFSSSYFDLYDYLIWLQMCDIPTIWCCAYGHKKNPSDSSTVFKRHLQTEQIQNMSLRVQTTEKKKNV